MILVQVVWLIFGEFVFFKMPETTTANSIWGHIEPYVLGDEYKDYIERMDLLITLNKVSEDE